MSSNVLGCLPPLVKKLESLRASGDLPHVKSIRQIIDLSELTDNKTRKVDGTLLVTVDGASMIQQRSNDFKQDVEIGLTFIARTNNGQTFDSSVGEALTALKRNLISFIPANENYQNRFYNPRLSDDTYGIANGFVWGGFTITYQTIIS